MLIYVPKLRMYVTIRAQKSRQIEKKAIITKNCAFLVCGLLFDIRILFRIVSLTFYTLRSAGRNFAMTFILTLVSIIDK